MNLAEEIGSDSTFGILILEDNYGTIMSSIKNSNSDIAERNKEIFRRWLKGIGKNPVTWKTFLAVLKEAGYPNLAKKVQGRYS